MKPSKIEILPSARREIRSLLHDKGRQVRDTIRELRQDAQPEGAVELRGSRGRFRLRVNGYRIVYRIAKDSRIIIERVRPRAAAYEGLD